MSKNELIKFLMQGTFTAELTTVNKDGSPHVVPVWFVLDERKNLTTKKIEDIILLHMRIHSRLQIFDVIIG
jgi:Pyridoxamine 5'-phosphate oxidase